MKLFIIFFLSAVLSSCVQHNKHSIAFCREEHPDESDPIVPASAGDIQLPKGYMRLPASPGSFSSWLRKLPLKRDRTVYLYNGRKKRNQLAQYAVVDIPVGDKDLQQCADAVMRLRAEYLFAENKMPVIFSDYENREYRWNGGERQQFESYLANVFGWCGSASLERQLKKVENVKDMHPGDVFVKGGFPGHAVIVVDMAENATGEKIYMLAQGYMPAQDIHILVNPLDVKGSPWYLLSDAEKVYTPEWTFLKNNLRRW